MPLISENWPNLNRWKMLDAGVGGGGAIAADGKLTANARNPIFQLRQPFTSYPVIDVQVFPHDDMQIYFTEQSESIDFYNLDSITYFGIYYELNFAGYINQFFLMRRTTPGGPLVGLPIFAGAPDTEYRILLGATSDSYYAKVFSSAGVLLYDSGAVPLVDSGSMSLLVNPGRNTAPPPQPWIGTLKIAWALTEQDVLDSMDAGSIQVPPIVVPADLGKVSFVESVYKEWKSPSFGGAGSLVFEALAPMPTGLGISSAGDSFVIFGRAPVGASGVYQIPVKISDGFSETIQYITLDLSVLSSLAGEALVVSAQIEALGDRYYRMAGGPLRKEAYVGQ